MTLGEIITTTEFEPIFDILSEYYTNVVSDLDRVKKVYKRLFLKLKRKKPVPCDIKIIITSYLDDCGMSYSKVEGIDDDREIWGIELTPWNKWLGMEIKSETLDKFEHSKIIAHCLWEMTFLGISEARLRLKKINWILDSKMTKAMIKFGIAHVRLKPFKITKINTSKRS